MDNLRVPAILPMTKKSIQDISDSMGFQLTDSDIDGFHGNITNSLFATNYVRFEFWIISVYFAQLFLF